MIESNTLTDKINDIYELFQDNDELRQQIVTMLKNTNEKEEEVIETISDEETVVEAVNEEEEEDLIGDSANYYYKFILKYRLQHDAHDKIVFKELIPDAKSYNYHKVILRIIAEIKLEINEYRREILRLQNECSKEELDEYKVEIKDLEEKIKLIEDIVNERSQTKVDEEAPTVKNQIVFMNKSNDKAYAIKDLENIPVDYYPGFLELIQSIENGTFKNIKFLTSTNNKLSGILEVKDFKIRVLFDRVALHTYCIIACFMKKSDNDKDYREFCINRTSTYNVKRSSIVKGLEDVELVSQNESTLNAVYDLLNTTYESESKRGG